VGRTPKTVVRAGPRGAASREGEVRGLVSTFSDESLDGSGGVAAGSGRCWGESQQSSPKVDMPAGNTKTVAAQGSVGEVDA
jgi:hypothetical protein